MLLVPYIFLRGAAVVGTPPPRRQPRRPWELGVADAVLVFFSFVTLKNLERR